MVSRVGVQNGWRGKTSNRTQPPFLLIFPIGVALLLATGAFGLFFDFSCVLGVAAIACLALPGLWGAKSWVMETAGEALRTLPPIERTDARVRKRLEEEPLSWADKTVYLFVCSGSLLIIVPLFLLTPIPSAFGIDVDALFVVGMLLFVLALVHWLLLYQFKNHPTSPNPFVAAKGITLGSRIVMTVLGIACFGYFGVLYAYVMIANFATALSLGIIHELVGLVIVLIGGSIGLWGAAYLIAAFLPFTPLIKNRSLAREFVMVLIPVAAALVGYDLVHLL